MESIQISKIDSRLRPQLLQEREKAIMLINEYSRLGMQQGTLAALRDSLGAIGLMFNNGGKDTFVPEVIFYTRSRLHPVWAWLAKMIILSTWRNYAAVNMINKSHTLVYAQLLNSRDTLPSIAEFKRIRQKPEWRRVIKGGQYAIEVSDSGTCIHVILLGDNRCSTDDIKRYVELAWKKVHPGRPNTFLTVSNCKDPLGSFQTGFLKSLQIPNLSRIRSFHKIEGLFPVYKFGNLNGEVALNYEARLDEVITALRAKK
jgi:hypothetical protein